MTNTSIPSRRYTQTIYWILPNIGICMHKYHPNIPYKTQSTDPHFVCLPPNQTTYFHIYRNEAT